METCRACAGQISDAVLAYPGPERKTSTGTLAIGGGARFPNGDEAQVGCAKALVGRTGIYNSRARSLA